MFNVGLPEVIFIFMAIFVLFGAKALPEIARGMGQGIKLFKKELNSVTGGDESKLEAPIEEAKDSEGMKIGLTNDFKPSAENRKWRPKKNPETSNESSQ